MSAKAGDDDDDDNEVNVEDEYLEDDDDDEEDDFHPGGDDDDDDDDEEYDDEEDDNDGDRDVSYLDGVLSYDVEGQNIRYKGQGFHLESIEPVAYNILDKANKPPVDNTLQTTMMGPCDVVTAANSSSGRKPTPRKIQVTFIVADPKNGDGIGYNHNDDDDEDEKKPSVYYQVYGTEIDSPEYGIDFKGGFAPISVGTTNNNEIRLLCQVRMRNPNQNAKPASTTTTTTIDATTTTAAAAVAVGKRRNYENDDDDDDNIDVDEDGIDHSELIALHEEAQLSTEALKKRYRGPSIDDTTNDDDRDNDKLNQKSSDRINSIKKSKTDDDDDDDIEF